MIAGLVLLYSADAPARAPDARTAPVAPSPQDTSPRAEPACADDAQPDQSPEDFAKTVKRHARLAAFTRHLQEERERAAFEEAVARHQQLLEFTRHLQEERAAEQEREFDKRVSQFVEKLRFLKRLLESRAPEADRAARP
jgi:hypothetical protein